MKIESGFAIVAATIISLSPLHVAAADAQLGRDHARQWCTSCHVVESGGKGSDQAPSFPAIANDPNRTRAGLKYWLANPHPPMPNPNLTRIEIDNIVTYIQSLRNK